MTPIVEFRKFSAWYGDAVSLQEVTLQVPPNEILGVIGPAGGGKTTLLRSLNRMNDFEPRFRCQGDVLYHGVDLDEVKDRLDLAAQSLSGGQQQRLCLARSLMLQPDVLLLDEPCSGLDPISTAKIEEALQLLKKDLTVVLVTNNVMQASRVADRTAFFLQGKLVEWGPTKQIFVNPREKLTHDYISGRFG
jgi:phosphate transport system ATP-binding protein